MINPNYKPNGFFTVYWTSEDGQSSCAMGDFDTLQTALAGVPAAKQETIDMGGTDEGWWEIAERDGDGDTVKTHDC